MLTDYAYSASKSIYNCTDIIEEFLQYRSLNFIFQEMSQINLHDVIHKNWNLEDQDVFRASKSNQRCKWFDVRCEKNQNQNSNYKLYEREFNVSRFLNFRSIYYHFLSVVTALNKEVLTGTTAEISCKVTGLIATLKTVKWEKSDGTDVTIGMPGYIFNDGIFDDNSQTTTLTVAGEVNTVDSTHKCLITPATQDNATEISTEVTLNIFSMYIIFSSHLQEMGLVEQTIFCTAQKVIYMVKNDMGKSVGASIK